MALYLKTYLYICFNQVELMTKNYFYIILFFLMLSATSVMAQDGKPASKVQENTIEGLSFYPNPATGGKIYISTRSNEDKQITIFEEGDFKSREKVKGDFNTSNFIYGLSTYIGYKETSLYLKYDLNPLFKDNAVKQNNVSLGLRFDLN